MRKINLLKSLPKTKRCINQRFDSKSLRVIKISREYGKMYFDGPRKYGYGGYSYDGRWISVAKDIIKHFRLKAGMKVLDVGCAKGFLVKDLMSVCPGLEVFGIDISEYAVKNCEKEAVGRLHLGNAINLPFPDNSFDCVVSLNTIHNFRKNDVIKMLKEIKRLSPKKSFVQVDSYENKKQKKLFKNWVLTARFHDYPSGWLKLFKRAGYTGDYYWTIIK